MPHFATNAELPATHTALTPHEQIGFAIGWDHARHRLAPPAPFLQASSPLRHGLLAGRAAFGERALPPTRAVRQWLQLRLNAWLRGRSIELFQVTPNYLGQIEVSHCPITRQALRNDPTEHTPADTPDATPDANGASIDRVRNDAGYAAGNLAVMSAGANRAKASHGHRSAQHNALILEARASHGPAGGADEIDGLTAAQWQRVATLCSFVEPLPHDDAIALPLHVLPPNRLRLFNPVQALQAFVSGQLLVRGWSQRVRRFEALLPGMALKRDFRSFFLALLPRVLEAGRPAGAHHARWAVEDAWRHGPVQQRWAAFAQQLSPAMCESLLEEAASRGLSSGRVHAFSPAQAADGWALDSRGYVAHVATPKARPGHSDGRQHELAL